MEEAAPRPTALLLSPHPDDELLGAPAHLFDLRDAGWRIVNLALSLGGDERHRPRRLEELRLACRLARFELVLEDEGFSMPDSRSQAAEDPAARAGLARATERVCGLAGRLKARLLVAPSPQDDHPAHEWTGRLALAALRAGAAERLWLWGLWADVALPNSLCVFDERRLQEIERALAAHAGELARSDFTALLGARARAGGVLLPERVLGYGAPGLAAGALGEGVCEVQRGAGGELSLGEGRVFDARSFPPAGPAVPGRPAGWLDRPSPRQEAAR